MSTFFVSHSRTILNRSSSNFLMRQLSKNPHCPRMVGRCMMHSKDAGEQSHDKTRQHSLVMTNLDEKGLVATLILNRLPVNSLNLELNQAISTAIMDIEKNHPQVQAMILKSANPKVLSAGIDLFELYQPPNSSHLKQFWRSFQQVFLDLYSSRLATIAAIEGHAPAGGCMLAMACDYRIMSKEGGGTIGLSESKLGIAAPYWLADLMVHTIGFRKAEESLGLGLLYTAEDALKIGLVDCIVDSKEKVLERAGEEAVKWAKIPPTARYASKMLTRESVVKELEANRERDVDSFCDFISSEGVQKNLGLYLKSLKGGK